MKISRFVSRCLCLLGLWLGLGLQAHAQTDKVTYVYTDPQGTPLVEADASGNIVARYDYTPYGSSVASLGNPPNGPGYTGHVNDPETGLVYMQARYYDPSVGRFLSADPATPAAGNAFNFNRYDYANNNPILNLDLDGRASVPWYVRAWSAVKGVMSTPTARRIAADVGAGELAASEGEEGGSPGAGMAGEETMIEQMELHDMKSTSGSNSKATIAQQTAEEVIPQNVKEVIEYAQKNNGGSQPGYRGGSAYKNDGRGGGELLPEKDAAGNAISYKEYDVKPYTKGVNRGAERVVKGSDGKTYYTTDHYQTFKEVNIN